MESETVKLVHKAPVVATVNVVTAVNSIVAPVYLWCYCRLTHHAQVILHWNVVPCF